MPSTPCSTPLFRTPTGHTTGPADNRRRIAHSIWDTLVPNHAKSIGNEIRAAKLVRMAITQFPGIPDSFDRSDRALINHYRLWRAAARTAAACFHAADLSWSELWARPRYVF